MQNLQTQYHFKLDFQKVDKHTEGKWLIHGTKKPTGLSVAKPGEYPSRESKHDTKESEGNVQSIMKGIVHGWKHPGRCAFAEPEW